MDICFFYKVLMEMHIQALNDLKFDLDIDFMFLDIFFYHI